MIATVSNATATMWLIKISIMPITIMRNATIEIK